MKENNKGKKRFNIFISLFLAVLLWLYVINVVNPNATIRMHGVPVILQGVTALESKDLMVTELSRDSMKLKVSGKRKTFLQLNQSVITVNLDVSKITEAGTHTLTGEYVLANSMLRNSLTVTEKEGFSVRVTVEPRASKEIPIKAELDGTPAEGFAIDAISAQPSVLKISGPEDVINQITGALVQIEAEQLKEALKQEQLPILFLDENGALVQGDHVTKSVNTCSATVSVVKVVELPLTLLLVPGGGAGREDARVTISPASITVSGSEALLDGVKEYQLGRVELSEIFYSQSRSFPISLPPGIRSHTAQESATVFITIEALPLRAISTTNIELLNVPEAYTASPLNPSIQVWLRGDEKVLETITADHIHVLVNLDEIRPISGQQRVPASVYLDADSSVGIVGADYSVAVLLRAR